MGIIFVLTAGIGIPHRLRADRAGGRVSTHVDPPWFWRFMSVIAPLVGLTCLVFLIQPRWIDFARFDPPGWLRLTGIPVGTAGVLLFAWMFRHLGLNATSTSMPRDSARLVTSGPYRWVRHPMYSAALLMVVASSLLTANLVVAIGGVAMFALLAARSQLEEQRLVEKFGEACRAYQRKTGRFFPRFR